MNASSPVDRAARPRQASRWAVKLRKWYLDGVSSTGDVCIGYQAQLHLGPLSTGYKGLLLRTSEGQVQDRSSWRRGQAPRQDDLADWHWAQWMDGRWSPQMSGMSTVLWDGPGARIEWSCVAPRCQTRVRSVCAGEHVDWTMDGYLECLEISLSALTLPFRALRWGRAIVASHSVVWIDWDEGRTLSKVWLDGVLVPASLQGRGPDRIVGEGWQVSMKTQAVLRDRELGIMLPELIRRKAGALAHSQELKYLGWANIEGLGVDDANGWAIYEQVLWR